jgi:2-amino-4-hydroxy-6-hydroxymethyldihydropteridine diphosphokinase
MMAYVGIGSNLGNREHNIARALVLFDEVEISSIYETTPIGYKDQPHYLNAVAKMPASQSPEALLRHLQCIERMLCRTRPYPLAPRTIDLDLLLYDDMIVSDEKLILPHPRMHERLFVLEPMCDIAANVKHPIFQKTMEELYVLAKYLHR